MLDAIERFRNETLRVFGVLEIHLSGKYTGQERDYLAGKGKGKYSIADIKVSQRIAMFLHEAIVFLTMHIDVAMGQKLGTKRLHQG